MNELFGNVFSAGDSAASTIAISQFMICTVAALLLGAFLAAVYSFRSRHTKSFVLTMFLLPAIVCVVIMMVNGNVGAGVAVAGAFSLVRFRSVPGSALETIPVLIAAKISAITANTGANQISCSIQIPLFPLCRRASPSCLAAQCGGASYLV